MRIQCPPYALTWWLWCNLDSATLIYGCRKACSHAKRQRLGDRVRRKKFLHAKAKLATDDTEHKTRCRRIWTIISPVITMHIEFPARCSDVALLNTYLAILILILACSLQQECILFVARKIHVSNLPMGLSVWLLEPHIHCPLEQRAGKYLHPAKAFGLAAPLRCYDPKHCRQQLELDNVACKHGQYLDPSWKLGGTTLELREH